MGIKTNLFTNATATLWYNQLVNSDDTYVFGSDISLSNTSIDSNFSNRQVLEKSIFGIKVEEDNVRGMINNTVWEPGVVYTMYDDQADLTNETFYVITEPDEINGLYHVFKCLFNNNGSASANKPIYSNNIIETGGESNLADGYTWKYMYTVPWADVSRFRTRGYFPVQDTEAVANTAVDGIDTILVENFNTNYGYKKIIGYLASKVVAGRVFLSVTEGYTFDFAANIYNGKSFTSASAMTLLLRLSNISSLVRASRAIPTT